MTGSAGAAGTGPEGTWCTAGHLSVCPWSRVREPRGAARLLARPVLCGPPLSPALPGGGGGSDRWAPGGPEHQRHPGARPRGSGPRTDANSRSPGHLHTALEHFEKHFRKRAGGGNRKPEATIRSPALGGSIPSAPLVLREEKGAGRLLRFPHLKKTGLSVRLLETVPQRKGRGVSRKCPWFRPVAMETPSNNFSKPLA